MDIYNYIQPVGLSERPKIRNMNTFIELYKKALYIAEIDYGSLEVRRYKFLKKIDRSIAAHCRQRISDCMGPPNRRQLTMDELYKIANIFSINMNYGTKYGNEIYQFTGPEINFERK